MNEQPDTYVSESINRKITRKDLSLHIVGLIEYIENMKKFFFTICIFALSLTASACGLEASSSLPRFWTDFRLASLRGNVQELSQYYVFPLVIKGPFDSDKPVRLSKKIFLREYAAVFRAGLEGSGKATFLKELEERPVGYWQDELKKAIMPNPLVCTARIDDYVLSWEGNRGWKVKEIYYNEDYDIFKNYLKESAR